LQSQRFATTRTPNKRHSTLRSLLLVALALVLASCSITRVKWRVKWDKDKKAGKQAFMSAPLETEKPKRQPNVIILLADDLGPYEVSAYGVDHIKTPHIDQIGKEGVVFEQGYATAPTCAPARSGLMTGRVQNRYGFETQVMEFYPSNYVEYISGRWLVDTGEFKVKAKPSFPSAWQVHKQGTPPTEIMLSEILKKYNYSTALIGKWHLGVHREQVPMARGFDYQYGIEDDTIIWFLSDNGGASYTHATDNGPLKLGKLTQFEGGVRVPFMMKWKGKVKAGTRYKYPVSSTDIYATSVAAAGGVLPSDRRYDGVNLVPYVNGQNRERPHQTLFWRADHIWAMRDGDYKLILSTRDGWAELHNLITDQSEEINLKEQMPELYEKLREEHERWQKENLKVKPMWPRIMDNRFHSEDGKEYYFPA
jgi:arylsulfatase A-like enzyme